MSRWIHAEAEGKLVTLWRIEWVEWQLNDGPRHLCEEESDRRYTANVSGVDVEANVSVAVFVLDPVEETGEVSIAETDPELAD